MQSSLQEHASRRLLICRMRLCEANARKLPTLVAAIAVAALVVGVTAPRVVRRSSVAWSRGQLGGQNHRPYPAASGARTPGSWRQPPEPRRHRDGPGRTEERKVVAGESKCSYRDFDLEPLNPYNASPERLQRSENAYPRALTTRKLRRFRHLRLFLSAEASTLSLPATVRAETTTFGLPQRLFSRRRWRNRHCVSISGRPGDEALGLLGRLEDRKAGPSPAKRALPAPLPSPKDCPVSFTPPAP